MPSQSDDLGGGNDPLPSPAQRKDKHKRSSLWSLSAKKERGVWTPQASELEWMSRFSLTPPLLTELHHCAVQSPHFISLLQCCITSTAHAIIDFNFNFYSLQSTWLKQAIGLYLWSVDDTLQSHKVANWWLIRLQTTWLSNEYKSRSAVHRLSNVTLTPLSTSSNSKLFHNHLYVRFITAMPHTTLLSHSSVAAA